MIDTFESQNPGVTVELTELSWSDGQAKIQLAFNSGTPPDVLHIGLDWMPDYDANGVLAILPDSLRNYVITSGKGALWTVNTRALVHRVSPRHLFATGLVANDVHNVIKRVLPTIWANGSPNFYTSVPVSNTMDSSLSRSLWHIRTSVVPNALIETSRNLDSRFLRGEIESVYTGPWIVNMIAKEHHSAYTVEPSHTILNGDVLCTPIQSKYSQHATDLIAFLVSSKNSTKFCLAVSDAGFPCVGSPTRDSQFMGSILSSGFLNAVRTAKPLPIHISIPRTERLIENMIVKSYTVDTEREMMELVLTTKLKVQEIERELSGKY